MKQITEREATKVTMRDLGYSDADIRAEEVRDAGESGCVHPFRVPSRGDRLCDGCPR